MSPASSIHLLSLFPGNLFAAARSWELGELLIDASSPCAFLKVFGATFRLGVRLYPLCEFAVDGDRPKVRFLRGASDAN